MIARVLYRQGQYWLYHKAIIDETHGVILEMKPEEKLWLVVKQNYCIGIEQPCYKLQKRDLIKVGRVRFKVRDIMSL